MLYDFYLSTFYFCILILICSECLLRLMLDTLIKTKYKLLNKKKMIVVLSFQVLKAQLRHFFIDVKAFKLEIDMFFFSSNHFNYFALVVSFLCFVSFFTSTRNLTEFFLFLQSALNWKSPEMESYLVGKFLVSSSVSCPVTKVTHLIRRQWLCMAVVLIQTGYGITWRS